MAYDTPLSPTEETGFQSWKQRMAPQDSGDDYDLRGAYKAGVTPDPETGHWPDTYKKPNHPTFSTESMYAADAPDLAGSWDGSTYIPPKKKDGYIPDDQEASTLLDAVGEEKDGKRRAQMVGMLSRYRSAKVAKGEPLFQPDAAAEMKQTTALESMFSGLDKMDAGMEPAQRAALKVAVDASVDGPTAKARMANQAYVLAKWPELAGAVDADWTSVKHQVAKQVFGNDASDIPETSFYGQIGAKLTKDKAERGMLTDVLANVQFEAAKGNGDWIAAWQKASKGMTTNAGYTPANLDRYRDAAKRVYTEAQQSTQELSAAIAAGKNFYKLATTGPSTLTGKTGPDGKVVPKTSEELDQGDNETAAARQSFLDELMRLPEAKRQSALNLAIAGAADNAPKKMGEEGDASFFEKGPEAFDRALGQFPRNVGGFFKNTAHAGAELSELVAVANSSPETRDLHWGALKRLRDDMSRNQMDDGIDQGLTDSVDPIKSKNRLAQGMLGAIQSTPYMLAAGSQPEIGIPLTLLAQSEDNRKEFVAAGVAPAEAATLAMASAAPMVALDRLHANMVMKGTLPGAEKWLAKAVGSKLGLARKMLTTAGIELTFQNAQQAVRGVTPAVYQEMASTLDKDVPGLNFSDEMAKFKKGGVDTFFTMLPMVLVGTGTASFKEAAYGRQYLSNKTVLKAAGFTDEAAEHISQTAARGDVQSAQALVQSGWEDEKARPVAADEAEAKKTGAFNSEEQKAAYETLDSDMQSTFRDAESPAGARASRNEDGSWTVIDGRDQYVDQATTSEHAMDLVRDVDAADSKNLTGVVDDMIDYFKQRGRGGPIEKTGDIRMLSDKVDTGEMTQERADRLVKLYADLGVLPKDTTPSEARIFGESAKIYNARTKLYEYVSRLHDGADPLTLIEEEAEGYYKQAVDNGEFTHEDVEGWRSAIEGPFEPRKNAADRQRESIEWFSKYAQAYITGKAQATQALPYTFRRWLDKVKKVFANVFSLAHDLIQKENAGQLPEEFKTHLARSVGLDDAFIERRARDEARTEAYAPEPTRYHAREALERIKLPTPKAEASGMKGELANLWKSLPFDQRMKVFTKREGTLDSVAEALRADYGFSDIKTGDDVVQLAERVLLRNEDVFSDNRGDGPTFDVRAQDERHINVDQLKDGENFTVVPKGDADPLSYGQGHKFLMSPEGRWVWAKEHEYAAGEILGERSTAPAGALGGQLKDLEDRGWLRVVDTGQGKGDASPLYVGPGASPTQLRELKNVTMEYGRTLTQDMGLGRQRILWAPDEPSMQLRKSQQAKDQSQSLFKEDELPFNLHGEAGQDHTGVADREEARREAIKKQGRDQGDLFADSRAQPTEPDAPVTKLRDGSQIVGPTTFQIRAYHGTPHDVDKFTTDRIGSGEGAQVFGWGLYFAQAKETAEAYREALASKAYPSMATLREYFTPGKVIRSMGGYDRVIKFNEGEDGSKWSVEVKSVRPNRDWEGNLTGGYEEVASEPVRQHATAPSHYELRNAGYELGNTYTVDLLPPKEAFLDHDGVFAPDSPLLKRLNEEGAKLFGEEGGPLFTQEQTGSTVYKRLVAEFERHGGPQFAGAMDMEDQHGIAKKLASKFLSDFGVPGIRYLDEGSRSGVKRGYIYGKGGYFYVQGPDLESRHFPVGETEQSRADAMAAADAYEEKLRNQLTHNFVLFDHDLVKIIEKNGKPVVAPAEQMKLGDVDDATMQLRKQVVTPEFKQWFGDSEIVDKKGEPLVVYHGTHGNFTTFEPGRAGAMYFSPNKEHAASGYGPNLMPAFLKVNKLADLTDAKSPAYKLAVKTFNERGGWGANEDAMEDRKTSNFDPERDHSWELFDNPDTAIEDVLRAKGYDGFKLDEYDGEVSYAVFDPTQIKSADHNQGSFDATNPDITMQMRKYVGTPEFKQWFGESKVLDEHGDPQVMYHGTRRADRVGTRFRKNRATSGPMPFFTSDPALASSYSTNKADTSLELPDDYNGWFKFKGQGMRSEVNIDRAWWNLSQEQRQTVLDRMKKIGYQDWDAGEGPIVADSRSIMGEDGVDYELRQAHGNGLKALTEIWLSSGALFNDESRFLEVLQAAGMDMKQVRLDDPHATQSAVYPAYLSIKNPLDTKNIPQNVVDALVEAGKRKRGSSPMNSAGGNPDPWDKALISGPDWLAQLRESLKNPETSYAFTRIPDWVTETLQKLGYDGVKDSGGKGGGPKHDVWVPFHETQVKSSIGNQGTFDATNPDITASIGHANRADEVQDAMKPRMIGIRVRASEVFADQVKQMLGQPEYAVRGMSTNEREARKIISDHGADLGRLMSTLSDPTQSMHPATKVALGFFVAEAANKAGDYRAATAAALWSAEFATSTGQAVNEFKRWSIFSNPETCQHLLQTQIEKENARRNERSPALAAVADTYAQVQKEARKLLKTWLDEINGVDQANLRPIARAEVGALPDVTFSLRPDIRETGIVQVVAKMLKKNGAEATETALLERYGAAVEKHIPDILIEAQRELMTDKSGKKAGKKFKTRIPELGEAQIEGTLAATRGKRETQLGLPNEEELKARGMSPEEIEKAMNEAGSTGSQSLADMPELYDKLLEHLMSKIQEKGVVVPKGIYEQIGEVLNRQGLSATPDDVKRVIGARQLIPDMDPAQAEELANYAKRIASTPLGSFERSQQTMQMFSYVHDQIAPHGVVDVAFGLWYANVLSGIVTSARNISGNASMLFLDQAAETIFRNPTTYFPYLKQLLKATNESWEGSKAQGGNTMRTGQEGTLRSLSQGDERRQGVLESKTAPAEGLRTISRLATRFLSVQDLFFANTAYEMKARQLAWDQATREAKLGKLREDEIEGRVDRLLNQATDQIQTFEDRAAVEWQNLDPEVRKTYEQQNWEKRRVKELQMFEREKQLVGRAVDFAQRVTLDYEPEGLMGLLMTNLSRVMSAAEHASEDVQNPAGRLLSKAAAKFARVTILPFMRVPVNIFNRAMDYGPVGYGRALMDAAGIPVLVGGSGKTRVRSSEERSDLLKRATVGTLALLPLAILARPRDPEDDDGILPWLQVHGAGSGKPQTNIALNGPKYRPYSLELRVGGERAFIDYRMFPLAPYLAAIGTMHDRTRYAKNKTLDEKSLLIQSWIIGQALKESMMSSSPITSLRELSEAAAENTPMSERSLNRVLARSTVGLASNLIPLSGLWRSLDQLAGGDRNTRDTLLSAAMAEIPVAGRLNHPSIDVLGDPLTNRTGIGWLADWSKLETPEARIYATFARKGITPADISRYQAKMTPEMFYEFSKARGQMLKDALLATDAGGKTGLDRLNELPSKARTADDDSLSKRFLLRMSRNCTLRALAQVGYKDKPETPAP